MTEQIAKFNLGGATALPEGDVTVSSEQLQALITRAGTVDDLQKQVDLGNERIALISPVASAGLELARKDISPEETKVHLATLIDADGTYSADERSAYLGTVGQEAPVAEPKNAPVTPPEGGDDMSAQQISELQAQIDNLKADQQASSSQATHANATLLKERMYRSIASLIREKTFAGGVVETRRSQYDNDEDGLGTFNGTISSQVEKATMALLRNELSLGGKLETLDIESLTAKAAEQVGGTLQTVIGVGGIGPLAETVSGQSQFLDSLNDLGDVKAPTQEEISVASTEEMSGLVDRQEQSSLQTLLKTVSNASQSEGGNT